MEIVRTTAPLPVVKPASISAAQSISEPFDSTFTTRVDTTLDHNTDRTMDQVRTRTKHRVLVCDQEDDSCAVIAKCLASSDFELTYYRDSSEVSAQDLRVRLAETPVDILLWGIMYPYEVGLKSLQELRDANPGLRVVLLAPQEALACASAIKAANCEAFVLKPLHSYDLRAGVDRALARDLMSDPVQPPRLAANVSSGVSIVSTRTTSAPVLNEDGRDLGLIGASREMRKVVSLIRKIGPSCVNVLITGESGSGKEMVASAIHQVSDRAKKPFIAINCAAIPRELLESELFGHAKGAFTGATSARRGLFEEANEGTILLDEIGDLPLSLQAKILRLLQTRQVKPLGQNTIKEVDVRIISATHKNLKSLIQKGEFREDLYYRLNVMPVHLPPLRDRKDDIVVLAEYFLSRYSKKKRGVAPELSKRASNKLLKLPWKGNVRELENVIERAIVMSDGIEITDEDIVSEEVEPSIYSADDLFNAGMTLKDIEREYIKHVLNRTGNRKETATRILGIDRKTLYRKEKLYGIRQNSTELN
jgi:DNA-binding NtrC family response regulator